MRFLTRRREILSSMSGIAAITIAGCLGDGEDGDDDDHANHGDHDQNGEENNNDEPAVPSGEGLVYAFAPNTIAVIDPGEATVVAEISEGINDESWGDPQITHDLSQVFVTRQSPSQVLAIDTSSHEIISEIDIGPGPVHAYHPNDQEIWAHADDEGTFYVIDVDSHQVIATVEAGLDAEGHGKLLYHEDFDATGYAMNVNDPGVPVLDMNEYERVDFVEFGEEGGTHYKAYSPTNGLIYVQRSGGVGQTAVVDPGTNEVVDQLDFTGGMYITPNEELLGIIDGDRIRFIDVTNAENEEVGSVEVEGGPDALRYFEEDDGRTYGFTANTHSNLASVIDIDAFEIIDELEVGEIEQPEGAQFLHRSAVAADGLFVTPAEADGFVAMIDMEAREVIDHVDVEEGVDTVQIIGDSGTGYTGRTR